MALPEIFWEHACFSVCGNPPAALFCVGRKTPHLKQRSVGTVGFRGKRTGSEGGGDSFPPPVSPLLLPWWPEVHMWARGGLGLGFTISGLSVSSGPDAARAFRLRLPGVVVLRGGEWNRGGGGHGNTWSPVPWFWYHTAERNPPQAVWLGRRGVRPRGIPNHG